MVVLGPPIEKDDLMKKTGFMLILGLIILNTGCAYNSANKIIMAPHEAKLNIDKPIPLAAGLLIPETSRERAYKSPAYPDYRGNTPIYFIEPYQIPIGPSLEKTALQIFSQVFREIYIIQKPEDIHKTPVVIELSVADFSLPLFYSVYGSRYIFEELVTGRCTVKIIGTVRFQQKTLWQAIIETSPETRQWVNSHWLRENVRDLASDTLVSALTELAEKMVRESQGPPLPMEGWLKKVNQSRTDVP
jgi:hypothetical protein